MSDLPMYDPETDANQAPGEPFVAQSRATMLGRATWKNRGAGRHKRGYRDSFGCMCMNMREAMSVPKDGMPTKARPWRNSCNRSDPRTNLPVPSLKVAQ
ncbi:hypothetical protein J7T55_005576 [Diaporthe amygdali]|uniref:uncharacterized protein n=1 Tax=Phomopsis amygdali TaxID=1214568 RepID=UPI0022FEF0E4|nr:uncharacterized protein J7T55_005576 [Diaporthe amygdali]KAJ0124238.1 hypothetical protein J7T55_005576 [Diaporthe amygdali]